MKWYYWDQNNSGGVFDVDETLCHRLFIEAETYQEAETKALKMGVYYNGAECDGPDCPCCGDRWYVGNEVKKSNLAAYKVNSVEEYAQVLANKYGFTKPDARLFYSSGEVKEVYMTKDQL